MKKVYDIFISDSVDVTVRRSAADQLATILAGFFSSMFSARSVIGLVSAALSVIFLL